MKYIDQTGGNDMVLNYMDYQIRQFENSRRAAVYRNGREILSIRLDDVLTPEKLVECAGSAMQRAGLAGQNESNRAM